MVYCYDCPYGYYSADFENRVTDIAEDPLAYPHVPSGLAQQLATGFDFDLAAQLSLEGEDGFRGAAYQLATETVPNSLLGEGAKCHQCLAGQQPNAYAAAIVCTKCPFG
eukprot:COSAG06_NODE_49273_length_326_cov_1.140969_1_plen_108_part_11